MKMKFITFSLLIISNCLAFSQKKDSVTIVENITEDTTYMITENRVKNKFFGNSWYISSSYTLSRSHILDFNIGRTYGAEICGGAGCSYYTRTWGAGVSAIKNKNENNYFGNIFTEFSFYYYFPFTLGTRLEYINSFTTNGHYLRPSIGFSFLYFDLFYGYTFKIKGENFFKHGLTIRIKNYHKRKNWELSYPSGY